MTDILRIEIGREAQSGEPHPPPRVSLRGAALQIRFSGVLIRFF
jgi:hypothetical protein